MGEYNLLHTAPKVERDVAARLVDKAANRAAALRYGVEYFDGARQQGFGGYRYDGRWVAVARDVVARYGLAPGDRVLDIGCGNGLLVKDLTDRGIDAEGLDVSAYALGEAPADISGRLRQGNALSLPYADASFDAVLCINTIHNLDRAGCIAALREIGRVLRRPEAAFVQVDAYTSPQEKALFEDWCLTALTYLRPEEWVALFREADYRGDYFWTILQLE